MTETVTILRREMEQAGAISLARFMEIALHCPDYGYYDRHDLQVGRGGDFYTSVSTGSLFGELLAFQFAAWLKPVSGRVHLVEVGAHDGSMAFDILNWLKLNRPKLLDRLDYWLVEPSGRRRSRQQTKLESFAGQVRWAEGFERLPGYGLNGIIFCNELLDSFPVHRLAWDRGSAKWVEWGVGTSVEDQFIWTRLPDGGHDWKAELARAGYELTLQLEAVLPNGYIVELCPSAEAWWRQAAASLACGRLLTIDYGFTAQELLCPERREGTLRAYHGHRMSGDVLAKPGEQDLTAHVNFTQLQKAGEDAGLRTEGLFTQAHFLTGIAGAMWPAEGAVPSSRQARQFQSLTHPELLGSRFRVFIQSRNGCL